MWATPRLFMLFGVKTLQLIADTLVSINFMFCFVIAFPFGQRPKGSERREETCSPPVGAKGNLANVSCKSPSAGSFRHYVLSG